MNVSIGKLGEKIFANTLRQRGWSVVRIPDGCKQIANNKLIRVKSPFDFMTAKESVAIFCDVKSTATKSFAYSLINQFQVKELLDISKNKFIAGYVVHFRSLNTWVFISAEKLAKARPGQSIKPKDCINLGAGIDVDKLTESNEL
jgi:penicillin-binding protein-related factor A (putative recombinase)